MKVLSQRTLVRMMEVLTAARPSIGFSRLLYEHDFPDWFVAQVGAGYDFDWDSILVALRRGSFFFPRNDYFAVPGRTISGEYLNPAESKVLGELFLQKVAALSTTLPGSESVVNALQLDGFSADARNLKLIPLENPVSVQEEEDALTALVHKTGITGAHTVVRHIADANGLYIEKKYHPSLNESRNFLQCLIDNIGGDTNKCGAHSIGFPGGTANRIDYLRDVQFLTPDEAAAFKSAWGALSAGSHPGVPEREEARIGLVLALEFGQLLLLKFESWKAGAYKKFAR
jgi:hypothetical protein